MSWGWIIQTSLGEWETNIGSSSSFKGIISLLSILSLSCIMISSLGGEVWEELKTTCSWPLRVGSSKIASSQVRELLMVGDGTPKRISWFQLKSMKNLAWALFDVFGHVPLTVLGYYVDKNLSEMAWESNTPWSLYY